MTSGDRRFRSDAGWIALQQLNETTRIADVKAAAVLATGGLLGSQVWAGRHLVESGPVWHRTLVLTAALAAMTSVLLALHTLVPRQRVAAPEPLHHFGHVARRYGRNSQGFIDAWLATVGDDDSTATMLAGHIWAAHLVAHRKFLHVAWSIRLLALALLSWLAVGLS